MQMLRSGGASRDDAFPHTLLDELRPPHEDTIAAAVPDIGSITESTTARPHPPRQSLHQPLHKRKLDGGATPNRIILSEVGQGTGAAAEGSPGMQYSKTMISVQRVKTGPQGSGSEVHHPVDIESMMHRMMRRSGDREAIQTFTKRRGGTRKARIEKD